MAYWIPGPHVRPGDAFSIPDLMIAGAWAEFHDLDLRVELDCIIDGVEPEEVLAFYKLGGSFPRWTMWHTERSVVVMPDFGPARTFASLPEALEGVGVEVMPPA